MRALLRAGADRLRERALDEGYAALAAATGNERAESRTARKRYVERTERHSPE